MRIVFMGAPGAGKGTQSAKLRKLLGVPHISTGEVLRKASSARTPLGQIAAKYFEAGRLVPDEVVVGIVGERLANPDCKNGCLFDGFPRTVEQAQALDHLLAEREMPLDGVIEIEIPEQELLQRLAARGRVDDHDSAIRQRLEQFEELTKPVLDYYEQRGILQKVDGQGSIDTVFNRIKLAVDQIRLA